MFEMLNFSSSVDIVVWKNWVQRLILSLNNSKNEFVRFLKYWTPPLPPENHSKYTTNSRGILNIGARAEIIL